VGPRARDNRPNDGKFTLFGPADKGLQVLERQSLEAADKRSGALKYV
jgi:hypothetical protein